jgi:glycosyltransferase involved in cell wall biosynthesis
MKWGDAGITPYIAHTKLNIDRVTVGEFGQVGKTPFELWEDDGELMHPDTRSFSLYERSSKVSAFLTEQYISESHSLYARLVRDILSENEWKPTLSPKKTQLHIPAEERKVHFCTTGPDFPYMYYLSVMTALRAFGDQVILWVAQEPKSVYFDLLKENPLLTIRRTEEVPDFPVLKDKDPHFRYANIFDHFIWRIVYEHGGILMGLDSLTLKPYWDLLEEGKEIFAPIDEKEVLHFAMGGAIVRKGSEIAKAVINDATSVLNGVTMKWGDAGITPYIAHTKLNIDRATLGEFGQVGRMPDNLWEDDGELMHPDTRSFSLYDRTVKASGALTEDYVAESQSLYARLVRDCLKQEEWGPTLTQVQQPDSGKVMSISSSPKPLNASKPKRFHLLGLPHLPTNKIEALACAYSQKALKMGQMLKSLGHTVFFYGVEGSTVECDEFIQVSTKDILKQAYGDYDYRKSTFVHNVNDIAYKTFNSNTIKEIKKRMTETDFLLLAWPGSQAVYRELSTTVIDDPSELFLAVESGIGYNQTFARFRVFESYAWYHHVRGLDVPVNPKIIDSQQQESDFLSLQIHVNKKRSLDGDNYDVVIPNFFDPDDFEYCEGKDDYFLYLGRIIQRKGIAIAIDATKMIGAKLIVAGQDGGERVNLDFPHVEYVGYADHAKRKQLLSKAKALFVPTRYIGPFEGVSIEAALSGTPVISCDWGALSENVIHGVTGYRCRNMDHYTWAAENIDQIKPADCYDFAVKNFSLERVKLMYEEYFNMIMDIKCGKGWYEKHPERTQLDWLRRHYI